MKRNIPGQLKKKFQLPFVQEDWQNTPVSVQQFVINLVSSYNKLEKRVEELEKRLKKNSGNSSKPPSSDNPFKEKPKKQKINKPKSQRPRQGHRQKMLEPTEVKNIVPDACVCGNKRFGTPVPYYTHQVIELPEIKLDVTHFVLHKCQCPCCGKMNKAMVPSQHRTGYGPKLSAMMAHMAGSMGDSRTLIQDYCASVLGFHISLGAIQKVIDRASEAITPHYETIGKAARTASANYIDETSYRLKGKLQWLWVMANKSVAFFMIHPSRSRKAFDALIEDWQGILVSDGYGVYKKWVGKRQSCLAHLIRKATELSESPNTEISNCGKWARAELQRLCHMANSPPTQGQWNAFYARLIRLISTYKNRKDDAGKFTRRLFREIKCLWTFLEEEGVAPTNNHAERMLRFAVI